MVLKPVVQNIQKCKLYWYINIVDIAEQLCPTYYGILVLHVLGLRVLRDYETTRLLLYSYSYTTARVDYEYTTRSLPRQALYCTSSEIDAKHLFILI